MYGTKNTTSASFVTFKPFEGINMYYMQQMTYDGEPLKVVLPDGWYLNTLIAKNVPVTHLTVAKLLREFAWIVQQSQTGGGFRNNLVLKFAPNNLQLEKFIGEQVIIFDSLSAMFSNSREADATNFIVEVVADKKHVSFLITDNGKGIHSSMEELLFQPAETSNAAGMGMSLFLAKGNFQKIGATLTYEGKADISDTEKPGAKFKITFLKEMPTAN